jgi:uncharacterized protein
MKTIKVGKATLKVNISRTKQSQAKGLMHIKSLPCDHGMVFEYPEEQILNFWMKNTTIPLSIAFIDKNSQIIEIRDMDPMSEKRISSSEPAQYALETNKGWFDGNNIKVGDSVTGLKAREIKIRVLKLPVEAKALAKNVEDKLVAMTKAAINPKTNYDSDTSGLNTTVKAK